MEKSLREQFKEIEKEVTAIARGIARETAKEVSKDLKEAHKLIMDNYYNAYDPDYYVRTNNLRNNSIIQNSIIDTYDVFSAGVDIGSINMFENYNISKDNVFDLMWNKGVRGLPKVRSKKSKKKGSWNNPYWQSKFGERENVFRTSINLNGYSSVEGTPAQVMADITLHWKDAGGEEACERAKNKVMKNY